MLVLFACFIAIALKAFWLYYMKSIKDSMSIPESLNSTGMYALVLFLIATLLYGSWTVLTDKRSHMKMVSINQDNLLIFL